MGVILRKHFSFIGCLIMLDFISTIVLLNFKYGFELLLLTMSYAVSKVILENFIDVLEFFLIGCSIWSVSEDFTAGLLLYMYVSITILSFISRYIPIQ